MDIPNYLGILLLLVIFSHHLSQFNHQNKIMAIVSILLTVNISDTGYPNLATLKS